MLHYCPLLPAGVGCGETLIIRYSILYKFFLFCVFVAGWRHALRSEWPFIFSLIISSGFVYKHHCVMSVYYCHRIPPHSTTSLQKFLHIPPHSTVSVISLFPKRTPVFAWSFMKEAVMIKSHDLHAT